jgi:hypothetical protein
MKVTAKIQGGLGNQLFQYATGKAISLRYGADLWLDSSWYNISSGEATPRDFLLHKLDLNYKWGNQTTSLPAPGRLKKILQNYLPLNTFFIKDNLEYQYNQKLFNLNLWRNQNIYLSGYWQSFRYFEEIRHLLLSEIIHNITPSAHYQRYARQIQNSPSAMIHIRRGDYVHSKSASKIHGFIGLNYYRLAMNIILNEQPETHFFVFSDDIDWALSNLSQFKNMTFINSDSSTSAPIDELFLMSKCGKHIIANSSLSWWGAWLSESDAPLVVCPSKWTKTHSQIWDDLLPHSWVRISC